MHPVTYQPFLEEVDRFYAPFPPTVDALLQRWETQEEKFRVLLINEILQEPSESARLRDAIVHEFCHLFCRHRGDFFFKIWQADEKLSLFDLHMERLQERQCAQLTAFFLVPRVALVEARREGTGYVAGALDVPPYLIELRWDIWRKYGR
jgi:hypothetical protein